MFITFEGGEASGKSTQSQRLEKHLKNLGKDVLHTREPGGGESGEMIRSLLLNYGWEPLSELFLFNANRHEHSKHMILPALNQGSIVICDRYMDSTMAYQGYGLGMDLAFLKMLEDKSVAVVPDLTIVIDVEVEVAKKRLAKRGENNLIDNREDAFHERVRLGFHSLAKANPARIKIVDGHKTEDALFEDILRLISSFLKEIG